MAARLLRPLKCLQVDRWGVFRHRTTVHFCSQAKEPQKPERKMTAADKTCSPATEAPVDRAALLAYKTTVIFPVRLLEPRVNQAPSVEAAAAAPASAPSDVSSTPASGDVFPPTPAPADVSPPTPAPADVSPPTPAPADVSSATLEPLFADAASEPAPADGSAAAESSSSSSSDSDSDSDSDSEDQKSEVDSETRTSPSEKMVVTVRTEDVAEPDGEVAPLSVETEAPGPQTSAATQDPEELSSSEVPAVEAAHQTAEDASPVVTTTISKTPAVDPETSLTEEAPVPSAGIPVTPVEVPAEELEEMSAPPTAEESKSPPTRAEESESPPTKAGESQGPPTKAAESQGPPTKAEESESPPTKAGESQGPPTKAAESQGPPTKAEESESPPTKAEESQGPSAKAEESQDPSTKAEESQSPPTRAAAPVESGSALIEAVAEDSSPSEELVDPAPVLPETVGEELVEPPAGQSEEPPEQEEPLDNSTYKNYQHHNYSTYTFADLDLEMARYRLPQPSSGRPSPRH